MAQKINSDRGVRDDRDVRGGSGVRGDDRSGQHERLAAGDVEHIRPAGSTSPLHEVTACSGADKGFPLAVESPVAQHQVP